MRQIHGKFSDFKWNKPHTQIHQSILQILYDVHVFLGMNSLKASHAKTSVLQKMRPFEVPEDKSALS